MDAWECIYDLVDTEYPSGWGPDIWFYRYCLHGGKVKNTRLGLIETMKIIHNPYGLETTNLAGQKPHDIMVAQEKAWVKERGIKLVRTPAVTIGYLVSDQYQHYPSDLNVDVF